MGDYTINNIYQGGYSSLSPDYGDMFTGYHVSAGSLALTTDPRTANLIKDASSKFSTGVKNMELAIVTPDIFDSIPKDHLQEVHRLSKLIGSEVSVHAPVIDSAGMTREGYSDVNRESAERRMIDIVERSHEVNPQGGGTIVFHSSEGLPSSEWEPTADGRRYKRMIAVNKETGQMIPVEGDTKYYPDSRELKPGIEEKYALGEIKEIEEKHIRNIPLEKGSYSSPEMNLKSHNATSWDNQISQLFFNKERADEILKQNSTQISHVLKGLQDGTIREKEIMEVPEYREALQHRNSAKNYLDDVHKNVNGLFSKAYEFGTSIQKKELEKISNHFKEELNKKGDPVMVQSQAMQNLMNNLQRKDLTPQLFVPLEEFAVEKSSKTFGNTAFAAYKKFGNKAPIIAIENPPANQALGMGEELRELVINSREQFTKRAIEDGLSKSDAEKKAEKLIGATWDVGHINMIRKQGFSEKDVVKETEKIAPFVKHIHLSDNFGFEHTELPMGMGNVPLKEMLEKLPEKDVKKVIEAGQWWQHMQKDPVRESLIGLGSPIYNTGSGPSWNQAIGLEQGYLSGLDGSWLPQRNYETFGTSFSRLPNELGGNVPGGGGRMSGTPME